MQSDNHRNGLSCRDAMPQHWIVSARTRLISFPWCIDHRAKAGNISFEVPTTSHLEPCRFDHAYTTRFQFSFRSLSRIPQSYRLNSPVSVSLRTYLIKVPTFSRVASIFDVTTRSTELYPPSCVFYTLRQTDTYTYSTKHQTPMRSGSHHGMGSLWTFSWTMRRQLCAWTPAVFGELNIVRWWWRVNVTVQEVHCQSNHLVSYSGRLSDREINFANW